MGILKQAAEKYKELLFTEYHLIAEDGTRKYFYTICFSSNEFKHPMALNKLKDIELHNWSSKKILDYALDDRITIDDIKKSRLSDELNEAQKRIHECSNIIDYLDKADTLIVWEKEKVGSRVEADILVQVPSSTYICEHNHLFFMKAADVEPTAQLYKSDDRLDLSAVKVRQQNGLRLVSQFTNSNDFTLDRKQKQPGNLTSMKILYKEKVEFFYQGNKKVEKKYTRLLCDKDFEIKMQKSDCFFSMQSPNIAQVKFNSPNNEQMVSNGAAVLASPFSPRPPFGQAVRKFLKDIVNKVKEIVKRLFRKSDQDTTVTGNTNRGSGNTPSASVQNQEKTASLKSETRELRDESIKPLEQSQKPLVTTAAAPKKTFNQGLDEFTKRPRAQSSPKPPVQNIANNKNRKK